MIKAKLNAKKQVKTNKFPLLAQHSHNLDVVLFQSENTGTVVATPANRYKIGDYYDNWISALDDTTWTILAKGSEITLTQN